jgi:hypothetical protein
MYTLLLTVMLVLVSTGAMAGWTKVEENNSKITYVDLSSILKEGDKAKMWTLYDFKDERKWLTFKYLSLKTQFEFDCKEENVQQLFVSWHGLHMGSGEVALSGNRPDNLKPFPLGNKFTGLWKIACGK